MGDRDRTILVSDRRYPNIENKCRCADIADADIGISSSLIMTLEIMVISWNIVGFSVLQSTVIHTESLNYSVCSEIRGISRPPYKTWIDATRQALQLIEIQVPKIM